jgi:8-oxo-dGTP pyrophosphatase MutT (NUDIX family)
MPAPDYVLKLRKKIGNAPLWVPGVRGVVVDAGGRVLLAQRADNRQWALVSGMLEPGEQPARGLVREIFEETAVVAEPERVVSAGGPWVPLRIPTAMCASSWTSCSSAATYPGLRG